MIQEISGYDYPDTNQTALREDDLMTDKTFIVWKDVPIEGLTDAQIGQLFKAMVNYENGKEVNITDPEVKGLWRGEKQKLDKADESYKQTCENNRRAINIRWERERKRRANEKPLGDVSEDEVVSSPPRASEGQEGGLSPQEKAKKKPVRHKYGTYKHVQLTDEQYKKLCSEHTEGEIKACIQVVDDYCEQSGKTYKNYLLVMNKWGFRALKEKNQDSGRKNNSFDFTESNQYDDDAIAKAMFMKSTGGF